MKSKPNQRVSLLIEDDYIFEFTKEFNEIFKLFKTINNISLKMSVDVLITNNKKIKKISKQTRGIDKETDILSFSYVDDFLYQVDNIIFPLGEIILSYEKIQQQANELNHSLKREFCFMFTHGLHHLLGLDHKLPNEEIEFNKKVYEIIEKMKISRN